ncbi:MAG: DJ-1 family glyoxalase III [Campylobacterota bacterium]|nr:DJ-1 family glyoxalase III [Campylobacterota bacterium]
MPKVLVPIAKGFEEIEAVALIDVMRRAGIEVLVASLNDHEEVEGANGITIKTDLHVKIVKSDELDMIVLPGGWDGTYALAEDATVKRLLQEMDAKGKNIGAICAAPYALHKAGVLKENFTCYPSAEEQIRLNGFQGDKAQVVFDGNVMTSRGPGTSICFGLQIVKKLVGDETYLALKEGLLATYCE